jgi:serine protease Do
MTPSLKPFGSMTGRCVLVAFFLILGLMPATAFVVGTALGQDHLIPATFADVAAKVSPAVVNISTEKMVSRRFPFPMPRGREGVPDQFEEFFDRFFGGEGPMRDRKEKSLGSGFIIDPSGLIITNNHVIEGADDIVVNMSDEKEYRAELLGRDPKTDLAVIKITGNGVFPSLTLGDSGNVRIGDWVVAIGNPFGLEHTVTAGILSARGRAIGAGPYDDFLQTDASINPGNSGGPLLNLDGEVIGINTAIVAHGQGIGFAIPTSMAKGIIAQLTEKGRVVRGWLGVLIQQVTPELAKSFNLKDESGALVADVTPGGPAEKAGLKRGDVIIDFNGRPIKEWSELPVVVADTPVGTAAKVTVVRNGKEIVYTVTLGELKDDETLTASTDSRDLGLTVEQLTPELAKQLGVSVDEGVIISGIADDSPAAESGLKPGDVILELNREQVKDIADYRRIAGQVEKGETVLFLIKRGANTLFFTMESD